MNNIHHEDQELIICIFHKNSDQHFNNVSFWKLTLKSLNHLKCKATNFAV